MKAYYSHRSWAYEDALRLGEQSHPILNDLGEYHLLRYDAPINDRERAVQDKMIEDPKCVLNYFDPGSQRRVPERKMAVSNGSLVLVRAGATLESLGFRFLTKDQGAKTTKRLKTFVRPFMKYAVMDELVGLVLPSAPELDGWIVFSEELHRLSNDSIQFRSFDPVQRAAALRALDDLTTFNIRLYGKLRNGETGELIEGIAKGNGAWSKLVPPGFHFVTSEDNIKSEVQGGNKAYAMFDYQGVKDARMDRQSFVRHSFTTSVPEMRWLLKSEADKALADVKAGTAGGVLEEELSQEMTFEESGYTRMMRRGVNAWRMAEQDLHDSLFFTEQVGRTWVESLNIDNPRKLRIPTPGDIRCQVVSEAAARLAGSNIRVERGTMRWEANLKFMVVCDHDWVNRVIKSHGGCDLDDFFRVMHRTVDGKRKIIIFRNPLVRGEYTVWDYVDGDWFPTYTDAKGDTTEFPVLTKKRWPKQILEGLADGSTSYLVLPSELAPPVDNPLRAYDMIASTKAAIEASQSRVGNAGTLELDTEVWDLANWPNQVRSVQMDSEKGIDTFVNQSPIEDQTALMDFGAELIEEVLASGKLIDAEVGGRLKDSGLPLTSDGPVSKAKKLMRDTARDYEKRLMTFVNSLKVPSWLEEIGNNAFYDQAARVLKQIRQDMWSINQLYRDLPQHERVAIIRAAQDAIILDHLTSFTDPALRAQFVMAFWLANRKVKTSGMGSKPARVTDQTIFGSSLFRQDIEGEESVYHLLDAMVYFGLAPKVGLDPAGNLVKKRTVNYQGSNTWDVECVNCGETYTGLALKSLVRYWTTGGTCKNCQ